MTTPTDLASPVLLKMMEISEITILAVLYAPVRLISPQNVKDDHENYIIFDSIQNSPIPDMNPKEIIKFSAY